MGSYRAPTEQCLLVNRKKAIRPHADDEGDERAFRLCGEPAGKDFAPVFTNWC
jgi:hypothetical protein